MTSHSTFAVPTLQDVLDARKTIAPYLLRTPLHSYAALDQLVGTQVYVKHENHLPIGAFKIRGGINLMARLEEDERRRGVITASTGNHGQSIAYAGRMFDVPVTIVVPEGANPAKVESIRNLGASIVFHGAAFDDAREHAERLAEETGHRYVHAANEPLLIAGVATLTLEIPEAQPDIDVIMTPIGGGSCAAGVCIVAKAVNPAIQVIGVQSEQAQAAYQSWKSGELMEAPMHTSAEGIATGTAYELPQLIFRDQLDDFVLVSDEEIRQAVRIYVEKVHTLAEGAGAVSLAGALRIRDRLAGKKVAVLLTGGDISLAQLREVLTD